MLNNKKIFVYTLIPLLALVISVSDAQAYYVNGVVDFSYQNVSSKIGGTRWSSTTWTEHYAVNAGSFVFDPRFLQWSGNVGYSANHVDKGPDTNILTYGFMASFFPGRMASLDLNASKGVQTVQSASNIAGYDVETTTYGASLGLRLSLLRLRRGNNNNNNNNNNSYNNSRPALLFPLPDIFLSANETKAISANDASPLNEKRHDYAANIKYRLGSLADLDFSAQKQDYTNQLNDATADLTMLNLTTYSRIGRSGDLKITGQQNTRQFTNISDNSLMSDRTSNLSAQLNFRSTERLTQSYKYDYKKYEYNSGGTSYSSQGAAGQVRYQISQELNVNGGLQYDQSEFFHAALVPAADTSYTTRNASLFAGGHYLKLYMPDFLDPFTFSTGYDLTSGFSSVTNEMTGETGSGRYYQNDISLGLHSAGWKQETANLDWTYMNKRDHSPLYNNRRAQTFILSVASTRIPKTAVSLHGTYQTQSSTSGDVPGVFTNTSPNTVQSNRSLTFDGTVDYTATTYLTLNGGASRGKSKSNADFTLANFQSAYDRIETVVFAGATMNYRFTRAFGFRGSLREEMRRIKPGTYGTTTTRLVNGMIDYRIRKLIMSLEYRWRDDVIDSLSRIQQQYFMAKIARPF